LQESGRELIEEICLMGFRKTTKILTEQLVSSQKFEHGGSRTGNRGVISLTGMFGLSC
jgi:hypothetical protein